MRGTARVGDRGALQPGGEKPNLAQDQTTPRSTGLNRELTQDSINMQAMAQNSCCNCVVSRRCCQLWRSIKHTRHHCRQQPATAAAAVAGSMGG